MEVQENTDHRIGRIIGERYKIVERIAAGASGVVYRAELIPLSRKVAIKFLHAVYYENRQMLGRFEREAQAMSKLSHPFCVSVIDYGIEDSPYIVMDFVEGQTLHDALHEGRFEPERAVRMTQQILAGIGHAHSQGIIHRDIKPANIQISQDQGLGETIRIFDFGLAKLLDNSPDANLSDPERIMGTPSYMSPEQATADKIDDRTDFYSIGIVLVEMLTGTTPFRSDDHLEIIQQHLSAPVPPLSQLCSEENFSHQLEHVVAKALAKKPEDRFNSAKEFAEALSTIPESTATMSSPHHTLPEGSARIRGEKPAAEPMESSSKPRISPSSLGIGLALFLSTAVILGLLVFAFPDLVSSLRKGLGHHSELVGLKERAEASFVAGDFGAAIDSYIVLRRNDPNNSLYIFRLAGLFFQKKWWGDSMEHYEETLRIDKNYARDKTLIQNVIEMLGARRMGKRAYRLLKNEVGKESLPLLKKASLQHQSPAVRQKSRKLIDELLSRP